MSISILLGLPGKVTTLLNRLTAQRALNLDYLDAPISGISAGGGGGTNKTFKVATPTNGSWTVPPGVYSVLVSLAGGGGGGGGRVDLQSSSINSGMNGTTTSFGSISASGGGGAAGGSLGNGGFGGIPNGSGGGKSGANGSNEIAGGWGLCGFGFVDNVYVVCAPGEHGGGIAQGAGTPFGTGGVINFETVQVVATGGAGGAGGGRDYSDPGYAGETQKKAGAPGGGSGGWVLKMALAVTPGAVISYSVGAGGAPGGGAYPGMRGGDGIIIVEWVE